MGRAHAGDLRKAGGRRKVMDVGGRVDEWQREGFYMTAQR